MVHMSDRQLLTSLHALDADEIDAMPWTDVPGAPGVQEKTLWQLGGFTQALIHVRPGAVVPGDAHLAAHHHIWIVSGTATVAGRRMTAGSYLHVPPDVEHEIHDVGLEGLTFLQMHRPHPVHFLQ
jgi:mannose-6-phosphate isomerase-like protein (cupin superfamily)